MTDLARFSKPKYQQRKIAESLKKKIQALDLHRHNGLGWKIVLLKCTMTGSQPFSLYR